MDTESNGVHGKQGKHMDGHCKRENPLARYEISCQDGKKVITNPCWHDNKPALCQVPIDLDNEKAEHGCGLNGSDACCFKCVLFWGNRCGCPSVKTFKIGIIRVIVRVVMAILFWGVFWGLTFPSCVNEIQHGSPNSRSNRTVEPEIPHGSQNSTSNTTVESTTQVAETEPCIVPGLPGTSLFGIIIVFLAGMVAEALIVLIPMPCGLPSLPPLLGSLLMGILLRNAPVIGVAKYIDERWSSRLRNMALAIILGRAGLEVDKKKLFELRFVVPRLAFLPCIFEACAYGVFAHLILKLPWQWSFMLGFVCSAVAPACVVPAMIKFQEQGFGVERGVPSLLIAGSSIDDIVAINVFNILLTIQFDGGSLGYNIGIAIAEIVLGIALGLVGGFFLHKFPDRRQHNVVRDRTGLLLLFSFFFIFMTDQPIHMAGAGTLGALVCSFVAAVKWQHDQSEAVAHHFKAIWFYFQPLLFGLTGAAVDLSNMDSRTAGLGIAVMIICLKIRLLVAGTAVSFLGWSHKEKLMTAISWIPKATVQAAIGGIALNRVDEVCDHVFDLAKNCESVTESCLDEEFDEYLKCVDMTGYALIILQVSVLLILITAPVGVFLIGIFGPRLLTRKADFDDTEKGNREYEGEVVEEETFPADDGNLSGKNGYLNGGYKSNAEESKL